MLASVAWDAGGDGVSWVDPMNWSTDIVPGAQDDVTLNVTDDASIRLVGTPPAVKSLINHETLMIAGSSSGRHATLTVMESLSNHGTIHMESSDGAWNSNLTVEADGRIINEPTGKIEIFHGSGGQRFIRGHFVNQGVVLADPGVENLRPGVGTNARVIGLFEADGGNIDGELWFSDTTLRMTAAQPEGIEFLFGGTDNRIEGDILPNATVWVAGSRTFGHASLTIDRDLDNHGTIKLESKSNNWDSNLAMAADVTLLNAEDGIVGVNIGTGGARAIRGHLVNEGLIAVQPDVGTSASISGQFDAAGGSIEGDLWFSDATLRMTASQPEGITFLFGGSGNRIEGDIPPNATVWVAGSAAFRNASLTIDQNLANRGTLRLESTSGNWDSDLVVADGVTLVNAENGVVEVNLGTRGNRFITGHVVNEGAIVVESGVGGNVRVSGLFHAAGGDIEGQLWFSDATLSMTANQPEGIEFLLGGGGNRIEGDILPNATVWISGSTVYRNASLTIDQNLVNHGTIRLESMSGGWNSNLAIADGMMLVNSADGFIEVNRGTRGGRNISGNIDNEGTIILQSDNSIGRDAMQLTNRGIVQNHGVTTTLTAGTFTNAPGGLITGWGVLNTARAVFINNGTVDLVRPSAIDVDVEPTLVRIRYSDTFGMDPASVVNRDAYTLRTSGGDGTFEDGNEEDLAELISEIGFDAQTQTVTIELTGRLKHDRILVMIDGSLVMNNNGDTLLPNESVTVISNPSLPNGSVVLDGNADIYFQDFDQALDTDSNAVGTKLPLGWVGNNGLSTNTSITQSFGQGRVSSGTYNAGPLFEGPVHDRALATGNDNSADEENALELYARVSNDVQAIRLSFDVEAWLGNADGANPGQAGFQVTLDSSDGGVFERVMEFNNGSPIGTNAGLVPGLLDGNSGPNRISFDSGSIGVQIPKGTVVRLRFDAQNVGPTSGWLFGLDNLLLRALPAGDTDGDGRIDQLDIVRILQAGKYLTGQTASWSEGDVDGDSDVDQFDVIAIQRALQGQFPKSFF